jgi:hypothetical protein
VACFLWDHVEIKKKKTRARKIDPFGKIAMTSIQ